MLHKLEERGGNILFENADPLEQAGVLKEGDERLEGGKKGVDVTCFTLI